mgnify:CR=1 FL=1
MDVIDGCVMQLLEVDFPLDGKFFFKISDTNARSHPHTHIHTHSLSQRR